MVRKRLFRHPTIVPDGPSGITLSNDTSNPNADDGDAVGILTAHGTVGTVNWSTPSTEFKVSAATGNPIELQSTGAGSPTPGDTIQVSVEAADDDGSITVGFPIHIDTLPTTPTLTPATIDQSAASGTFVGQAGSSGGKVPLIFSQTPPTPNDNFDVADDGIVTRSSTGTITSGNDETLPLRVTDANGNAVDASITITVTGAVADPPTFRIFTNVSGGTLTNWPVHYPGDDQTGPGPGILIQFPDGYLTTGAKAKLDGVAVNTSGAVTKRFQSGCIKEAWVYFTIPSMTNNVPVTVTFTDAAFVGGAEPALAAVTASYLAAKLPNAPQLITAQSMLDAGHWEDYQELGTPIPIGDSQVSMRILGDFRSVNKTYNMGFTAGKVMCPIFVVTWIHTLGLIWVRPILENAQYGQVENEAIDSLTLTIGSATYVTNSFASYYGTFQSPYTGWIGGTPSSLVNVNSDLDGLNDLGVLPNYDPTFATSVSGESYIAARYSEYTAATKGFYRKVNWTNGLPGAWEGQTDHGYHVDYLLTGDYRLGRRMFGNANHGSNWRMFQVESSPTLKINQAQTVNGIGEYVSMYSRGSTRLLGNTTSYTASFTSTTYAWEMAHNPQPWFIPYILTGDWFYRRCIQNLAATSAMTVPVVSGLSAASSREPRRHTPVVMGYHAQYRSDAWQIEAAARAQFSAPDGSPGQEYFQTMVEDEASVDGGLNDVALPTLEDSDAYTLGENLRVYYLSVNQVGTLGWKGAISSDVDSSGITVGSQSCVRQLRQQNYFPYAARIAVDFGMPILPSVMYWATPINDLMTEGMAGNFAGISAASGPKLCGCYEMVTRIATVIANDIVTAVNELTTAQKDLRINQCGAATSRYPAGAMHAGSASLTLDDPRWAWYETNIRNNALQISNQLIQPINGRPMRPRS